MVKSPLKHSLNVSFEETMFGTFSKEIQEDGWPFPCLFFLFFQPLGHFCRRGDGIHKTLRVQRLTMFMLPNFLSGGPYKVLVISYNSFIIGLLHKWLVLFGSFHPTCSGYNYS